MATRPSKAHRRPARRPRTPRANAIRTLLANLVASSQEAIFSRSLDGTVTTWNEAAERIFGYRAEEIVGRPNAILVPPDRKDELQALMGQIRRGDGIEEFETVRLRKDGRLLQVSLSVSPLRGRGGRVVGASTIARDITAEKELDAAVLEAAEQERRRLGRDLHDGLGQQLGGMELLCRSLVRSLSHRKAPEVRAARLMVRQIQATVEQVRALARGLTPVMDDSNGLMLALAELASTTQKVSRIRCRLLCEEPVLVPNHTAAVNLFRIAQEAVGNATRHGRPRRIEISLSRKNAFLRLEIRNDGRAPAADPGSSGLGQRIMAYRAGLLGGTVALLPLRPRGARVVCVVPFPQAEP